LRGRTDGEIETAGREPSRPERRPRAHWLVQAGVDPTRIRTTWQPIGDHIASNGQPTDARMNRRVEIELYRSAPQLAAPVRRPRCSASGSPPTIEESPWTQTRTIHPTRRRS
jgi:hypothetical protein